MLPLFSKRASTSSKVSFVSLGITPLLYLKLSGICIVSDRPRVNSIYTQHLTIYHYTSQYLYYECKAIKTFRQKIRYAKKKAETPSAQLDSLQNWQKNQAQCMQKKLEKNQAQLLSPNRFEDDQTRPIDLAGRNPMLNNRIRFVWILECSQW